MERVNGIGFASYYGAPGFGCGTAC